MLFLSGMKVFDVSGTKVGKPAAASGALELLGGLMLMQHLEPRLSNAGMEVQATARSDNLGNTYVLAKHFTNRWPGAAIVMELAAILLRRDAMLCANHKNREQNQWADDLANEHTDGWDPAKRWDPIPALKKTLVMGKLLTYGYELGLHHSRKERNKQDTTVQEHVKKMRHA